METVIKLLADGLMIPIVILAVYALLVKVPHAHRYDIYTRVFMAGLSSYMLAKFVGALWQPEKLRPFEQLGIKAGAAYLNNPGFPSDHTLFAGFLTIAVWYAIRSRWITLVMITLTILVAAGRVLAHVHTLLDVAGGIIFAVIGAIWYIGFTKKSFRIFIARRAKR
jgi:membrane-associated phospholipid phosphatase